MGTLDWVRVPGALCCARAYFDFASTALPGAVERGEAGCARRYVCVGTQDALARGLRSISLELSEGEAVPVDTALAPPATAPLTLGGRDWVYLVQTYDPLAWPTAGYGLGHDNLRWAGLNHRVFRCRKPCSGVPAAGAGALGPWDSLPPV